ncbi:DUF2061 domain-containing protein [Chloroflexota bacterium]
MPTKEETEKLTCRESRLRSSVKSLSYRVLSIAGTGIITWVIIKDITETVSITLAIQVFLIILYYSHERIWDKVNWERATEAKREVTR